MLEGDILRWEAKEIKNSGIQLGILSIESQKTRPLPQNFYQIKLYRGLSYEKG
jgi:hypothetical protein